MKSILSKAIAIGAMTGVNGLKAQDKTDYANVLFRNRCSEAKKAETRNAMFAGENVHG